VRAILIAFAVLPLTLAGCTRPTHPPLQPVAQVDLPRFMGSWYVIGNIPTPIEREAYNAVERYARNADGTIATTFTFRKGGFDGPEKTYRPKGFVLDASGAVWGMQFLWPVKAEYLIVELDRDYRYTVIARNKRDYLWIMAREPQLDEEIYQKLLQRMQVAGYDVSQVRKVPQRW
jgi:apolipoprotein D and lipocalin family protein